MTDPKLIFGRAQVAEDLPDALRVPLNELQADCGSLIGRVMLDGAVAGMVKDAILNKLSQIETASYQINADLIASQTRVKDLEASLNERDLFVNPKALEVAADEIDCERDCESGWHEFDTNASGCRKSERGDYCPNDVAETLRALAKIAHADAALKGDKP